MNSPTYRELAEANGWRTSAARHCPRVIAGRLCIRGDRYGRPCVCEQWADKYGSAVVDHSRMWLTAGYGRVLTYEPYGDPRNNAKFEEFRHDCTSLGLVVTVHPKYPSRSGGKALVVIARPAVSLAETR